MLNPQDFAQKLELILSYYQLTASSFADKIGVQRSSISHLLSGRNKPGLEFVIKIVEYFPEVDLYWFLMNVGAFPKSEATQKKEINKSEEVQLPKSTPFIPEPNEPTINIEQTSSNKTSAVAIEKIIVLYKDGSFKNYHPQEQ